MDLNFVRLAFSLVLEKNCVEPFLLYGMKSCFIDSLRKVAGCSRNDCSPCERRNDCSYHQVLSQELSPDPSALRRYQKPALPFVFDIPQLPPVPNAGHGLEIGLTVAGTAVNYLMDLIAAVQETVSCYAERGWFVASVVRIESVGYGKERTVIMEGGGEPDAGLIASQSISGLLTATVVSPATVTLSLRTPTLLLTKGKPLREFCFSIFLRGLMRRISSLVHYYGGVEGPDEFRWLAGLSHSFIEMSSDFRWIDWGGRVSGLLGRGTFTGDLTDFYPFLLAGEYFHVGKGASYGQGSFVIDHPV